MSSQAQPNKRIPVAILGATGSVGQRFIQLLEHHPWFEIVALTGSERTAGRPYGESARWILDTPMPAFVAGMTIGSSDKPVDVPLAFSALPSDAAREVEPLWAAAGVMVCSNASSYRMAEDVPLLIPEINPDHIAMLERQRRERGWQGGLVTNPNCSTIGLVMALRPLYDAFGINKAMVTTLQAVSGAGYPGVASLDILDNVVPYIGSEEDKVETEPLKLLGRHVDGRIDFARIAISAQCTRVPVIDGHTEAVSLSLDRQPSIEEVVAALEGFRAPERVRGLPTAPAQPVLVRREVDRPQPRRDRDAGNGMAATVGRVRPCPLFGVKFIVLSHNTIRGAAGGAILNAELLVAEGVIA